MVNKFICELNAEAADLASLTLRAASIHTPHHICVLRGGRASFAVGGPFKWVGKWCFEWGLIQQVLVPLLLILLLRSTGGVWLL